MLAAVLLVAMVAEDPAVLHNAPRDDAPAQATLWRGDWLEVRGETCGFLKVYDHRHERPGYVRPSLVRIHRLDEASAPELRAVVRFLRDAAGSESLGIGYAALFLRAAPAGSESSEIFAAIGSMADRLARRVSARQAVGRDGASTAAGLSAAAQLEVVESYGVRFRSLDAQAMGGRARLCYDGEAWARVLASPGAPPVERARAALFLAGGACLDPALSPADRRAWNDRRLEALDSVDAAALLPALAGRLRLRLAEALAWRSYDEARREGAGAAAAKSEIAALRQLALTDRGALAPEDLETYDEVAVRVAAAGAAAPAPPAPPPRDAGRRKVTVAVVARAPGESCLQVLERTAAGAPRVAAERCTYGVVWQSALRWSPAGTSATIAVQPLPAWTELWVLRRDEAPVGPAPAPSWTIEPLTPATVDPEVGYVEAAGFSPDGARLLVAREARAPGRAQRRFQILTVATLAIEKQAGSADKLLAFKRWGAPSWRAGTLALR
jgi:hypothetical protein